MQSLKELNLPACVEDSPVGIVENDKIKVTLLLNPFSVKERKEYYIKRTNIGEILSLNGLEYTKDFLVIDGDQVIYGNKSVPHNNHLIIRLFPTGTGNTTQDVAAGEKVAGGVLTVAGIIVAIAGAAAGLAPVGIAIAGAGVSLLIGGIIAYNTAINIPEYEDTKQLPSIRGSKNQTRVNGRLPVLLGRHRIYPDNASLPYVNTDSNSIQTLNQLYCAGYSNLEVDMDTVKIGETFFRPDSDGASTVYTNANIKVNYGGTYSYTYYEGRRVDVHYGEKLTYNDAVGQIPLIKTTSTNTKKFYVRLLFPNGLIKYDDSGNSLFANVEVRVEYKKSESGEDAYQVIGTTAVIPTPPVSYLTNITNGQNYISVFTNTPLTSRVYPGYGATGSGIQAGTKVTRIFLASPGSSYQTYWIYIDKNTTSTTSGYYTFAPVTDDANKGTLISTFTSTAFRKVFEVDLDNLIPSGDDYSASRQYDIRVTRISKQGTSTKVVDDVVLESIKTENGIFNNTGSFNDSPIIESIKEKTTLVELNIQATDQLNGVIDQINFEGTVQTRNYSGTGSGVSEWSTVEANRNPASMFLYVLTDSNVNQHPIDDSKIDFPALEEWWTFCENKGFTCDAFINYEIITNDLLSNIATCGRASWNIVDGIYTVIVDDTRSNIIQMFTPRNSSNYSATKSFPDKPTVLSSEFVNADSGYVPETIDIYNRRINGTVLITAGTDIVNGTGTVFNTDLSVGEIIQIGDETHTIQSITSDILLTLEDDHGVGATNVNVYVEDDSVSANSQLFGVTSSEHAWKLGKYQLAVSELRPIVHTFNADIENMICTKGDRIKLRHDVPLYGLYDGRIKSLLNNGVDTTGFVSDEIISMVTGTNYTVRFRQQDGTFSDAPVVNPGTGDYTTITLSTPISGLTALHVYDLFTFGETGSEDIDLIISEIQYSRDFEGTLTCVDYSPEIFNADTGTVPYYDSKISKQGDGAGSINPNNITDVEGSLESTIQTVNASTESLTARFPDSFESNYDASYYFTNDNSFIYYVNYDNGNIIYKKSLNKVNNGNAITSDVAGTLAYYNEFLIYTNISQGGVLYKKSVDDADNGTAVTTAEAWCPTVDDVGNCFYINYSDGFKVYVCDIAGDGTDNGIEFLNKACTWISYGNGSLFYMEADGIVHRYEISSATDTAITTDEINKFSVLDDDEIIIVKAADNIAYSIDFDGSNETPEFEYAEYVNCNFGNLLYSSGQLGYSIYPALENKIVGISTLESSPSYATITGDITTGINTISGISNVDLDKMAKGDFVIGDAIPDDTVITLVGAGYIYISNPATATNTDVTFEISGSRIFLNANKVIVPGTISAELMEASALNSKARDINGNPISEANLDAGTQIYRKQDGTVVFDFDPNRTGEELKFAGTLSGESTSVDENAGYSLDAETGDAVFNNITLKGNGNFGGLSVNQLFNGEKIFEVGDSITDITTWLSSISLDVDITVAVVGSVGTGALQYIYWQDTTTVFYRIEADSSDVQIPSVLTQEITFQTIYEAMTISSDIIPINTDTSISFGSDASRFNTAYLKQVWASGGIILENNFFTSSSLTGAEFYSGVTALISGIYKNNILCTGYIQNASRETILPFYMNVSETGVAVYGWNLSTNTQEGVSGYYTSTLLCTTGCQLKF